MGVDKADFNVNDSRRSILLNIVYSKMRIVECKVINEATTTDCL